MKRRVWTEAEVTVLHELYPNTETTKIAEMFGMKLYQVYRKAASIGLKKSPEYFKTTVGGRFKTGNYETQFKKGQVPWNKGVKGSTGNHPNTVRTQFKKGEMSGIAQQNYKPIGSLRVSKDGYIERKVTDDHPVPARRWVGVHRLVWEEKHGPVPPGHIVIFKPGMKPQTVEEITLDRLELISKSENMKRNTLHRYPKDIALAIQLRGALNRKINNVSKHK